MAVRHLVVLGGAVLFETAAYTAITPMLPPLIHQYAVGDIGAALLVAVYPAGAICGAIAAVGLAVRWGVRLATVIGVVALGASCLAFAFAANLWQLDTIRFIQGVAGAIAWTGALAWIGTEVTARRRAESLGIIIAAGVIGGLFGPLLGWLADATGRRIPFPAVAMIAFGLAFAASRLPAKNEGVVLSNLGCALTQRDVVTGVWLVALASVLFSSLTVLASLSLAAVDVSEPVVAGVWLFGGALVASSSPLLGRWCDAKGVGTPVRSALVASALVSLALAWSSEETGLLVLIVIATTAFNAFWVPGGALLSVGADGQGLSPVLSSGLFNLSWAPAGVVGSFGSGLLASQFGAGAAYMALSLVCAVTYLALRQRIVI